VPDSQKGAIVNYRGSTLSGIAQESLGWPWDETFSPQPAPRSLQLGSRRREQMAHVLAHLRRPVSVVVYTRGSSERDTLARSHRAQSYALDQRWRIADSLSDSVATDSSAVLSTWADALSVVMQGFANGILACDRSSLPADDNVFEEVLDWLSERGSFLAYVPRGWASPQSGEAS
jgi:hypothetical protein